MIHHREYSASVPAALHGAPKSAEAHALNLRSYEAREYS